MFKIIILLLLPLVCFAQRDSIGEQLTNQKDFQVGIKKAKFQIKIDGILDEVDWQEATLAKDFWEKYPDNKKHSTTKTEVRLTYDDHNLYLGFVCYDSSTHHIVQTLKRDVSYFDGDAVSVVFDPINQKSNGYMFGVSPLGVQSETTIQFFGDPSWSWDTKWQAQVKQYADRWTVEMAIPFKSLRYEAGKTKWGINFVRNDIKHGKFHTWARVPLQFEGTSIFYLGALNWDAPPPVEKNNATLIPYVLTGISKESGLPTQSVLRPGLDVKMALNSQLNLDATINSDFSQVDVDEQVTNLTRFNIFYPEKRTFFLENSDVLSELGSPGFRPFFSRTIGLDSTANRVPILFGARLSGNVNKNMRINAFDMQTGETDAQAQQNYFAAAIQQVIKGRSFFKLGLLNKQGFENDNHKSNYARELSGELSLTSKNNQWDGWLLLHRSFHPNITDQADFLEGGVWYHNDVWQVLTYADKVGTNYYTGMDYFQRINNYDALYDRTYRIGFKQNASFFNYKIVPKSSEIFAFHEFQIANTLVWNNDNSLNNRIFTSTYTGTFKNTSTMSIKLYNEDSRLPVHTSFTDFVPLPPGQYVFTNGSLDFSSDKRQNITFLASAIIGEFYNGKQLGLKAGFSIKQTPWGVFSLRLERYDLQFPDPYKNSLLYLINSKTELSFSKDLIWTTFLQYNTQNDNFNINSRLQWRYKPMSDLFIVYTDNYAADGFLNRNRALVLKMNYWINL